MLQSLGNEKGSLAYVILIALVLGIFVPGILMLTADSELTNQKAENEKMATGLAVSGLQAFVKFPGTSEDKLNYVISNNYGWTDIRSPQGKIVGYGQYVVPATTSDFEVLDPAKMISANSIDPRGSYKVVIAAIAGDSNNNRVKDNGETFYYQKILTIPVLAEDAGSFTSITATPNTSQSGTPQSVTVAISAAGITDNTAVTVELLTGGGSSLSPSVSASGVIINNTASMVLTIPASIPAGSYKIQATAQGVSPVSTGYTITPPFGGTIQTVTPTPNMSQAGSEQYVAVAVATTGFPDNAAITVELVTDGGRSFSPAITANGTITKNAANVLLLIPSTIPVGNYKLKITSLSVIHASTAYSIVTRVPPSVPQAFTFFNGVQQTFTKSELENNVTILTSGQLFIPASYGQINTVKQMPVNYSAEQGIYIGAEIQTKANGGHIHLRSCRGPIVINGATFANGTGNADITMEAGTYISAKGASMYAGRNLILTANQTIDVSNPNRDPNIRLEGKNISLTARTTGDITRTGTNFSKMPNLYGNPNKPVACP